MMNITVADINIIAPGGNQTLIAGMVTALNKYLPTYEITTINRLSNFLGQAAEETAGFRTFTEYASGVAYNGRKDLGNVEAGDGPRFKGRGIFMITGRTNYTEMSKLLKVDLVTNPLEAASPEIAVQTACYYWKLHNLNAWADKNDQVEITKLINGGTNGLSDRELCTNRAIKLFTPIWSKVWTDTTLVKAAPPIVQPAPPTHFEEPVAHQEEPVQGVKYETFSQWIKKFF